MNLPIKITSRSSPLALAQVDEIIHELKTHGMALDYELIKIETAGDIDKSTPLTQSSDNFFTDTIDRAILEKKADIAIHSAKDLPQNLPEGLKIFALTKGLDDKDAWAGRVSWKDLPSGAKIGTSSLLRQSQILQLRPDITIVNIRGTIHERLRLIKEGQVDGVIVAACALKRLHLESEIKDIFPWDGMPLQGQLAVVGRTQDHELEYLFESIDIRRQYGKVTLVGAGPGDIELITLKGIKALEATDCVFYDYLIDQNLLKYAQQAEHIYVGKRKGEHSLSQDDLSRLLKEKAMSGKSIVRLKGGDPLIFGRGADEIQYLRSYHIDVSIIPGVSSATGIPSVLGIPLTARGISSSTVFLSGHQEDEHHQAPQEIHTPQADTLVFLMGLTKLPIIVGSLLKSGKEKNMPIMVIANGTKPQEQIVKGTLSTIEKLVKDHEIKPPALIIAGKIVDLYKPIEKKVLLHCGTHPEMYAHLGKIIHWPMIEIKPAILSEIEHKNLLENFQSADIIVFTSWYAVENFFWIITSNPVSVLARSEATKQSLQEQLQNKTIAVIGRRTQKALEKYNIQTQLVSLDETAQGLFKLMSLKLNLKGQRVLFPRSSLPNPFLKKALINEGAIVEEIPVYINSKPVKKDLPKIRLDGVIFTSPSTVQNFLADYGKISPSWEILAKGPVTLKTLQEAGYRHAASLS